MDVGPFLALIAAVLLYWYAGGRVAAGKAVEERAAAAAAALHHARAVAAARQSPPLPSGGWGNWTSSWTASSRATRDGRRLLLSGCWFRCACAPSPPRRSLAAHLPRRTGLREPHLRRRTRTTRGRNLRRRAAV